MSKRIELWRHTDNDGDALTDDGLAQALEAGRALEGPYDIAVSSGAQRSTQTIACMLAAAGITIAGGVVVEDGFRSRDEARWRSIYQQTGSGTLEDFLAADEAFVREEARRFADAVRRVAALVPDGGRALVMGHSPTQECAAWAVSETFVPPLGPGEHVVVVLDGADARVQDPR